MKGKGIERYWGYLGLIVLVYLWVTPTVEAIYVAALSGLVTLYFLFQVPVWCSAVTREGTLCRRNSYGLLMGCSYRQHKWQRVKMTVVPHGWRRLNRGLWVSPSTSLATISIIVTILGGVVSLIQAAFGA